LQQHGFTLIELLVAMIIALVVVGAAMSFIIVSIDQENAISSRTIAARNAETALGQLARDLRQAMTQDATGTVKHVSITTTATTPPTTTISFSVPVPGTPAPGNNTTSQSVTWTCQGSTTTPGTCKRQVGSGGNQIEIVGYESASFTDASGNTLTPTITDPAYLGVQLSLQVTSQLDRTQYTATPHALRGSTNPIVVQTGIDLRNVA
jgi:prepilin-type N-terminal cleavage/methylation domain-containing protein